MFNPTRKFIAALRISFVVWTGAALIATEPSSNYQVQWEREFGGFSNLFFLQGAGVDGRGNLWVLTSTFTPSNDYRRKQTLFRIDSSGDQKSAVEIEAPVPGDVGTDLADYYPAITSAGPVGFLINVSRARGRSRESRGTFYAPIFESGTLGDSVSIFATGPLFWRLIPLTDGDLLAVGDQSPLVIQKISPAGAVRWQSRFSKWLDVPDAAAMPGGGSCVVSSEYPSNSDRQELHLLHLDASGRLQQQTQFHGHLAKVAAGPNGSCAVFYYDYSPQNMEDARYHLTAFNASLTRQWTREIPSTIAGKSGMAPYLITSRDGYLAGGIAWSGDLFLAKYSWSGELRWREAHKLSCSLELMVPGENGSYLIGKTKSSFKVTRFAVLR